MSDLLIFHLSLPSLSSILLSLTLISWHIFFISFLYLFYIFFISFLYLFYIFFISFLYLFTYLIYIIFLISFLYFFTYLFYIFSNIYFIPFHISKGCISYILISVNKTTVVSITFTITSRHPTQGLSLWPFSHFHEIQSEWMTQDGVYVRGKKCNWCYCSYHILSTSLF